MPTLRRLLLRTLWRIRGQVLAIGLVVGAGIAIFIMSLGTLHSLEESRDTYYERGRFPDVFAHLKRAPDPLARQLADIPGVNLVDTRVAAEVLLHLPGMDEPARGHLVSVPESGTPPLNLLTIRRGRSVQAGNDDEVVVAEAFAQAQGLQPGDRLAATVNGRYRNLLVVGIGLSPEFVYSIDPGTLFPDDRHYGVLWMGHEALAAAFDLTSAFNDVAIALAPGASETEVIAAVDRLLARYAGTGAYGRKDQVSNALLSGEIDQLRILAMMLPPAFLGVAAFLLYVAVSRLVDTEREQIGLLKACGYGNAAIARHYLVLALSIVAVGTVIGLAGGFWLGHAITGIYGKFYRFPALSFDPQPVTVMEALGLAAVLRAAALPPAVAMQPAPPPVYRSLAPRLARLVTEPSRIVLRNVMRWPVRSALTVLGIGLAVADIVASLFSYDAIERMIDLDFFLAQRQGMVVSFYEPRAFRAVYDAAHMPGSNVVEPFRTVAVRLRAGPRSERIAITGLAPEGRLRRVVDADLRPMSLPPQGLMLSGRLAELLGVRPGDSVVVEALEGRRPVQQMAVAGLVEEYIGKSAYMNFAALNRFMGDDDAVSGLYMLPDPLQLQPLYRDLLGSPAVGAVTLKAQALLSFRRTIAESMGIMLSFYVGFGALIAFGVLYNNARIGLSERARELASLRVLGFTRYEVSYIFLGEMGVLTLVALPVGCLLGYAWAWTIAQGFKTDMFTIPLVVEAKTYGWAALTVLGAALVSGWAVRRRIDGFDLVAVLKTRE